MKINKGILAGLLFFIVTGCNRDNDPIIISYFSSIVFENYATNFTDKSIESKELFDSLHTKIADVGKEYNKTWSVQTTWGDRHSAYAINDSIALELYDSAVCNLLKIKEEFNIEKEAVKKDGSFDIQLSFLVTRDYKLRESEPINYNFGE
ncbi:MAG: hypothetical protein PUB21_12195 [Bacteroidales bacterium]|nr:hypothetical protein [Bacteroidales bacterium]